MSEISKTVSTAQVDAAIELAEGSPKPKLATQKGSNVKLAKVEFEVQPESPQSSSAVALQEQGEILGESIIYANANAFNRGIGEGASNSMAQAKAATKQLIEEVDQQSADYFRQLAERYGG